MSRRMKLIIAALFLVLLAIPTVYIALTLHPRHPLQFRLVRLVPHPDDSQNPYRTMEVRIANTNPTPITFFRGELVEPTRLLKYGSDGPGHVFAQEFRVGRYLLMSNPQLTIPAHSDVLAPGEVAVELVEAARKGDLLIDYVCESETASIRFKISAWMVKHSPRWAVRLISFPEKQTETATLEPMKTPPSSGASPK